MTSTRTASGTSSTPRNDQSCSHYSFLHDTEYRLIDKSDPWFCSYSCQCLFENVSACLTKTSLANQKINFDECDVSRLAR